MVVESQTDLLTQNPQASQMSSPQLSINPSSLDFGTVNLGASDAKTTIVSNAGSEPLTVTSVSIDNPLFTVNDATPVELNPGQSVPLSVTFTPNEVGPQSGVLTLGTNVTA
ncbi:MAG: hypothetical protein ETSY2_38125 [Candidatus Entotheonella gemina]|uniref:Transmembrane protein 131-like N-terminal domain-containing protein n=1 Tax=Candidatus Entotheonella gemina TaxID=1429439 RepID=W4LSI2_9BACT|nr:MAG: hypothetical protein ETSY2_38125 [Candidatus Entotheonella gemina]